MDKKIIGYILLGLASLMWILPLFIGFIDLPTKQKAILLTTIIIFGEGFFVLSIIFLGKEFVQNIKYFLKIWWRWLLRKF